ncbi:MAG: sulfurtransferase TusA family protein [Ferrovum myxofaciens]|uniref:sulfurtransferase TusA family protein n=1 Tax=Ferrovum myxofaciens TaxID=416213 RepID=UPI0023559241|nr:sulfurtransferase TusA family protein [Ferrovum myxofaciens]QKE40562.1 MAG: sulfurtransferase TusA family protein [Ferrovum myxofaciens]
MTERKIVDGKGSFCPGPLMELIVALKHSQIGDELEVLSTDKGSANDIPEWVHRVGHDYVSTTENDGVWHIVVRKTK